MNEASLDFEQKILDLRRQLEEAQSRAAGSHDPKVLKEVQNLEEKLTRTIQDTYSNLSPWQRVLLARHPQRPYTLDYIGHMITDFVELHGDRLYSDDKAIVGGLGSLQGRSVVILGHQKGRGTKENLYRNFGMANPEGYRKALRLMKMAAKFKRPVITLS